jgi:hypothetical protein
MKRVYSLVDAGVVPVPPSGNDSSLFDCPDHRLDPVEELAD